MQKKKLLIVGAGPVGLAAALFISSNPNISIDIIEKNPDPRVMIGSKALAINPRTISLFSGYPIQKRLIEAGIKVNKMCMKRLQNNKIVIENNINEKLKQFTSFPHMLIYPQCQTEAILEAEINKLGINIRKGIELTSISNIESGVNVKFNRLEPQVMYDYVLGTDGSKSFIRKQLKIPFPGQTLQDKLYVADYIYEGEPFVQASIHIGKTQTVLLFPVKKDIVRVVCNSANYQKLGSKLMNLKECVWKSDFTINNRYVEKMGTGNIYLAGDAAHIHAPIGGRGMNLGIEDVFVFSHLLKEGRLNEYNSLRKPVVENFVKRIMKASVILKQKSSLRKVIPYAAPVLNYFGGTQGIKFMTGLDHEIPFLPKL